MRIDIYAGEAQPIIIGHAATDYLEILSEKSRKTPRVFLRRKDYLGELKIVCADCPAKIFTFELRPNDLNEPIRFGASG